MTDRQYHIVMTASHLIEGANHLTVLVRQYLPSNPKVASEFNLTHRRLVQFNSFLKMLCGGSASYETECIVEVSACYGDLSRKLLEIKSEKRQEVLTSLLYFIENYDELCKTKDFTFLTQLEHENS